MDSQYKFDYIIIGAGTSGCVLASRLSESSGVKVLLIEAGGSDADPYIAVPAAAGLLLDSRRKNWNYLSVPQKHLNDRSIVIPRGKVLGGSSSINGMVYVRGNPMDFDRWAEQGATGWSYAEVLPYFLRSERHASRSDAYHGKDGAFDVMEARLLNPLHEAFLLAGTQGGHPLSTDFNGARQEGVGRYDLTIRGGRRCSVWSAFLKRGQGRPNLTVQKNTLVERILFDGNKAVGVRCRSKGRSMEFRAEGEVIVAGGAINSPQLLLLSGVGPAEHLRSFDIPVVANLPGVGRNLQDHLEVVISHECTQPVSLYRFSSLFQRARVALQWAVFKEGIATTSHFETGGFLKTGPEVDCPDVQLHFLPALLPPRSRRVPREHGFQSLVGIARPKSHGVVRLQNADSRTPPLIDPCYLSDPEDWVTLRKGIAMVRQIFSQQAFDSFRGPERLPGAEARTPKALDAFIRSHASTGHHFCGTCKMGDDAYAVVDTQCRVVGTTRLRVVDASIMPSILTGNTNAATIMIAERICDAIRNRFPNPQGMVRGC
ncbi:choline dehydrogenase [Mesorhizobium sp. A623]